MSAEMTFTPIWGGIDRRQNCYGSGWLQRKADVNLLIKSKMEDALFSTFESNKKYFLLISILIVT
jgi:hypothetical protein